jgi:Zn-dependent protease/CBS domain-containing protein
MLQGGISIGRIFGISIRLHYSWFIIFALFTWAFAVAYFPSGQIWGGHAYVFDTPAAIILGIITSILFFGSVLAHEIMHSVVSIKQGIPVQAITLFILGGVSQITEEPKKPVDEFRMAFAGPLTSIVLGLVFWGISLITYAPDYVRVPAYYLGFFNLFLGVFNLIPGFPLDGGRVLRSLIWWNGQDLKKATRIASRIGQVTGYLFVFVGILGIFNTLPVIGLFNGLWLIFIGWFLISAASSSYQQMVLQEILKGHTASEIMTMDCNPVPPGISVDRLVSENVLAQSKRCFTVVSDDKVEGLVTLHNIQGVPKDEWKTRSVREIMTPLDKVKTIAPGTDLNDVFKIIAENNINQVPVIKDGKIVGMITRENIVNFINVRNQLSR